ncbi:feline leukemia virus subgroup C receptor-related protein 2 isoform X2 [Cimex lectularius]|nr:feline leukemia virus subgroup C receptor-related protein 2 isoform X2 [Cimex lectularius]
MLALFVMYSMSNAMQWIQYSIIENVVVRYYGVSSSFVEWTSMVYMVSYIILIVPGSWALDRFGLRKCVLAGALGTCLGSWVKVFSSGPDSFVLGFLGQTAVAISQVFVLSVPARLAAVWFGQDQVSSACSIGVFGNQLGVALGFLIPPSVVPDVDDNELVGSRLGLLFKSVAGFTSVLLVLIIFFYEEQPPLPPSQAALKQKEETPDFVGSIKRLLSNIGYILLLVSYGINVGVFYAISTLLNKVIITYFQNASEDAGRIGLTIVISGTVGSVVSGFVLDKTHKFKEVTLVVYLFSLIGLVVYNFTLDLGYIIIVYVTAGFLGFFMTGYLPVGFELAAELTYPEPEGTSVGILNGFCQIFGILFTIGYSALINAWGTKNAGLGLISTLAAGTVMTYFIPKDYKRQESGKDEKEPA